MKGIVGLVGKAVLGGIAVIALLAGIWQLRQNAQDNKNKRDEVLVIDEPSGISWKMGGEPELVETSSELAGDDSGVTVDLRIYTVDHGDWIERVQVFDAPPGELDFTVAATSTFDAPEGAQLGDVEYTKYDRFDAAIGRSPAVIGEGDDAEPATASVFASQVNRFMVTGGVAQLEGADEVDVAAEAQRLLETGEVA